MFTNDPIIMKAQTGTLVSDNTLYTSDLDKQTRVINGLNACSDLNSNLSFLQLSLLDLTNNTPVYSSKFGAFNKTATGVKCSKLDLAPNEFISAITLSWTTTQITSVQIKTNLNKAVIVGKTSPISSSWNFDQNKQLAGFSGRTDSKGIYSLGFITLDAAACKEPEKAVVGVVREEQTKSKVWYVLIIIIVAILTIQFIFIVVHSIVHKDKPEEVAPIKRAPSKIGVEEIDVKTKPL